MLEMIRKEAGKFRTHFKLQSGDLKTVMHSTGARCGQGRRKLGRTIGCGHKGSSGVAILSAGISQITGLIDLHRATKREWRRDRLFTYRGWSGLLIEFPWGGSPND